VPESSNLSLPRMTRGI